MYECRRLARLVVVPFTDNGYHVFDVFISFADILIFVIITGLFVWFISVLLGGD